MIAEDFYGEFDRNDLLAADIAKRYRQTVLEKTGSMPANDLVKNFLDVRNRWTRLWRG